MATLEILIARPVDAWAFVRMRPADAAEVWASGRLLPVEAVRDSIECSNEAWTARVDGEVMAIFGIMAHPTSALLTPLAIPWMLTTAVVDRYPKLFWKYSRGAVHMMHRRYGTLINYVDTRHEQARRWLARLGFKIYDPIPFGAAGELFHPAVFGGGRV